MPRAADPPGPAPAAVRGAVRPELAPFVSSVGLLTGRYRHARELALPTGTAQLLVNLDADELWSGHPGGPDGVRVGGAALQGPASRPTLIDPAQQRAVLWVAFRPGGAYPFFRPPGAALRDDLVDLAQLWGRDGAVLRERLADAGAQERLALVQQVLVDLAVRPLVADPAVRFAARALHRGTPVGAVADRLGWTTGRLAATARAWLGLTPKRFARVRRFQRLLRAAGVSGTAPGADAHRLDWARLAAECGYHDQAHLIHEFRTFSGLTPTRYLPRSGDEPNHVPLP